jgi:ParB-like chromosome segregation protein Spo0J
MLKAPTRNVRANMQSDNSSNYAKIQGAVPETVKLNIANIKVPKSARRVQKDQLKGLIDSIKRIGLQNPITVRRHKTLRHLCVLVAGGHRLEAFKSLGLDRIPARIIEPDDAKIWTISENLHRVELSRLERAEAIAKFAARVGQSARPLTGGKQPYDMGNSETARQLKIDRKQVREARANANISDRAKKLLIQNGLDDNQKVLGSVAKCETAENQIERVKQAIASMASRKRAQKSASKERTSLFELERRWNKLRFRKRFESAPDEVKRLFVHKVLNLRI